MILSSILCDWEAIIIQMDDFIMTFEGANTCMLCVSAQGFRIYIAKSQTNLVLVPSSLILDELTHCTHAMITSKLIN